MLIISLLFKTSAGYLYIHFAQTSYKQQSLYCGLQLWNSVCDAYSVELFKTLCKSWLLL